MTKPEKRQKTLLQPIRGGTYVRVKHVDDPRDVKVSDHALQALMEHPLFWNHKAVERMLEMCGEGATYGQLINYANEARNKWQKPELIGAIDYLGTHHYGILACERTRRNFIYALHQSLYIPQKEQGYSR